MRTQRCSYTPEQMSTALKANAGLMCFHVTELPLTEHSVLVHPHNVIAAKIQPFSPYNQTHPSDSSVLPISQTDLDPASKAKSPQCLHN